MGEHGLSVEGLEVQIAHELGHAKRQHLPGDIRAETPEPEREFEADRVGADILGVDVMVAGLREFVDWWAGRGQQVNVGRKRRPTTEQRIQRLLADADD